MLPKIPNRHEKVEIDVDGRVEVVEVRGLTRAEAAAVQKLVAAGDIAAAECAVIAFGTDTPDEEALAWYEETPSPAVDPILEAIGRLSRINEGAQFRG